MAKKLTDIKGIGKKTAEKLEKAGVKSPRGLAALKPETLAEKAGMTEKTAEKYIEKAKKVKSKKSKKSDSKKSKKKASIPDSPFKGKMSEKHQKLIKGVTKDFNKEVLDRYGKHIKSIVLFGSAARGDFKDKSDIDIVVIADDTSMNFKGDLKNKFDEKLSLVAKHVSEKHNADVSVQPSWLLTEFWEMIRTSSPLVMTFLRDGVPVYDDGFFVPVKRLMEMGKFPATREAVQRRMETVPKRIKRAKNAKLYVIAEDVYYAMLDSTQAVLMYLGQFPPTSKEAAQQMRKHLVSKGLIEEKYAKWMEEVLKFRKEVEHKDKKDVDGEVIDMWLERADEFYQAMESIVDFMQDDKKLEQLAKTHEVMIKATAAALKSIDMLPENPEDLPNVFEEHFIDTGKIDKEYMDIWDKLEELHTMVKENKVKDLDEEEVQNAKESVRSFLKDLKKVVEEEEKKQEE